jgi:hypothetical protein
VDDMTAQRDRALVGEPLANVEQLTGGTVEIRVFSIEPAAPADPVALLGGLPLDCLRGAKELEWLAVDPARVLAILYGIAAGGAEYNAGMGGPYGRLHAWRSLAGLVGVAPESPLPAIEARASECQLTWFAAPSDWFERVMNDMGLCCVRPSRQEAAVVAATTSD